MGQPLVVTGCSRGKPCIPREATPLRPRALSRMTPALENRPAVRAAVAVFSLARTGLAAPLNVKEGVKP
jgi:hypothetical protein